MPKKVYRYRNWLPLILLLALIIALSLNPFFLYGFKSAIINTFTTPAIFVNGARKYLGAKSELIEENRTLREKVAGLSLEIERLQDIVEENLRLRDLLRFRKKFKFKIISAEITGRDPNNWSGSFVIDRGLKDGVRSQGAVCSVDGLLGKIADAYPEQSLVLPLSHPSFKAGGVIKGSRLNGMIVGAGGGTARLEYIPMDGEVREGDVVITSALSRIFPEGILVGEVVSVHRARSGLYKYAVIKPYAALFDAEEVFCVLET